MNHAIHFRLPLLTATAAAALLAACGGGNGADGLSTDVAQGYAADSATMTVTSASGMDTAASALESGVSGGTAVAMAQAQSLATPDAAGSASGTAACAGGSGTVAWTVTSPDASTIGNGQLDAGELYAVTYTNCATGDNGLVLNGQLSLSVLAHTATTSDLMLTATALTGTTAQGSFTYNGSLERKRSVVTNTDGSMQVTAELLGSGLTLATSIGTRQANYTLNALDWTVVRSFNAAGQLTSRTHSGHLDLASNTPRRPNATLQITTVGALTISSDGLAASGHFTVVTSNNTIDCVYGNGNITLTLDLGNNGTIDRTWVLTRTDFDGSAG